MALAQMVLIQNLTKTNSIHLSSLAAAYSRKGDVQSALFKMDHLRTLFC